MTLVGDNKAEYIVIKELEKEYGIVKKRKETPRFLCGEDLSIRVDVKYCNNVIHNMPVICMTNTQFKSLKDEDLMYIVKGDEIIAKFKWKDRKKYCIVNVTPDYSRIIVKCSPSTKQKYKEIENKLKTTGEQTIIKLLEIAEQKIREEEKIKKLETI